MASKLFGRSLIIIANDGKQEIEIETRPGQPGIQCKFDIQKSADSTPNEADIELYNLKEETRAFFYQKNTRIILKAGCAGEYKEIFKGNIELPNNAHENTEWCTKVHCKDGGAALRTLTISKTFKKGTYETEIINAVLKSLLVPPKVASQFAELNKLAKGKIQLSGFKAASKDVVKKKRETQAQRAEKPIEQQKAEYLQRIQKRENTASEKKLEKAEIFKGLAWEKLTWLCKEAGLIFSVTNGVINIYPKGLAYDNDLILLTPQSGLIGSPERIEKGFKVISQLMGEIEPGKLIACESKYLDASFLVQNLYHRGDTTGAGDWVTESICTEFAA